MAAILLHGWRSSAPCVLQRLVSMQQLVQHGLYCKPLDPTNAVQATSTPHTHAWSMHPHATSSQWQALATTRHYSGKPLPPHLRIIALVEGTTPPGSTVMMPVTPPPVTAGTGPVTAPNTRAPASGTQQQGTLFNPGATRRPMSPARPPAPPMGTEELRRKLIGESMDRGSRADVNALGVREILRAFVRSHVMFMTRQELDEYRQVVAQSDGDLLRWVEGDSEDIPQWLRHNTTFMLLRQFGRYWMCGGDAAEYK